ncbi:MAG: hypothetical protein RIQ33_1781 [Bacteroidota bacterium]|jgi:hypothetical protein
MNTIFYEIIKYKAKGHEPRQLVSVRKDTNRDIRNTEYFHSITKIRLNFFIQLQKFSFLLLELS